MIQKIKSKKGFTLAELLIVVAIIGVLVAIAIPVFGSQLDKANKAVTDANFRSAKAQATVEYLVTEQTGTKFYDYTVDANKNLVITTSTKTTEATTSTTAGTVKVEPGKISTP